MQQLVDLSQKTLIAIRVGSTHEKVHPAWQDHTNDGFLICYEVNLDLEGSESYLIQPCEIEMDGRYPSLGLSLELGSKGSLRTHFECVDLPLRINSVIQSDVLGEDVINQYELMLENKARIVIRHVFPPMMMGIRIEMDSAL